MPTKGRGATFKVIHDGLSFLSQPKRLLMKEQSGGVSTRFEDRREELVLRFGNSSGWSGKRRDSY
jgi:hypothetical protein